MARKYVKEQKATAKQLAFDTQCTALYIRVSTERQADEGFSLDAQEKQLRAFCVAQDWHACDDHIYVDAGISGKGTVERKAFQRMLQAAEEGKIKRIVAIKLDRVARNVKDFLAIVDQLKGWGCDLVLIKESFDTSTAHGRFAITMFAAIAELEASTITERVMMGKAENASQGGYNGSRCPLGYTYQNGAFTVNDRADVVRSIFDMFNRGLSLNAIVRRLNDDGIPTATGGSTWFVHGIKHILANGAYAGISQWDGVETSGNVYPAIIDKTTYEAAQERLQGLSRGKRVDLVA